MYVFTIFPFYNNESRKLIAPITNNTNRLFTNCVRVGSDRFQNEWQSNRPEKKWNYFIVLRRLFSCK